jgi:ubiquinone/menaquinone biosynthesis C-methylase UbiE
MSWHQTDWESKMDINQVERFWNKNLCGSHFVTGDYLSEAFFAKYRRYRYKKTHHLDAYVNWEGAKGKDVLEIGLGIGADACRWAKHAKSYTGIDITSESVFATKAHLQYRGLKGNIEKGNAEGMVFHDESFDIVYSHGVLHHTPNISKAFNEIWRVLKKDGEFILMVYARNSLNWWLRIQFYFRLRVLLKIVSDRLFRTSAQRFRDNHPPPPTNSMGPAFNEF